MTEEREQRSISRRTITKGAAWAVPAVPLVIATPAYAVSGGGPTGFFNSACKQPGASCQNDFGFLKGYTFLLTITNPTNQPLYVYPTLNNVDNPDSANPADTLNPLFQVTSSVPFSYSTARRYTGGAIGVPLNTAELIAPGGSLQIIINAGTNSNSANTDAVGALFMAWGHTAAVGADPDHPYAPVPPANPPGEGWFRTPFSFGSTPPCVNCAP